MTKMKQSRKMYGCKLCKTLYSELHKVSSGNLKPTNLSIELHLERDHPGLILSDIIDHISKFSRVSEARAVLVAHGYEALLGPRIKSETPDIIGETTDSSSKIAAATQSRSSPRDQVTGDALSPSHKESTPQQSLVVVLKVSSALQLTPPASTSKSSNQNSSNLSSSPLPVSNNPIHTVPSKLKQKQSSKAKKSQDWIRLLDRTGKPCRSWVKKPFQVKSFTQYSFDLPAWQKEKAEVEIGREQPATTAIENVPKVFTLHDSMANDSQLPIVDNSIQKENLLTNTAESSDIEEKACRESKATPKILGDSNVQEIRQLSGPHKRVMFDEIENRPAKKTKTVEQRDRTESTDI